MKIVVTTCPKYQFLLQGFIERFVKYWGEEILIDIAGKDEPWSDQLIRICNSMTNDYFIRLCEDFYIQEPVNLEKLYDAERTFLGSHSARLGLQSVDDGYRECSSEVSPGYFRLHQNAQYLCSMEASIWNRKFLLKYLESNLHIWETEIKMSDKVRIDNPIIIIPEKPILIYKDATRRGELRI